MLTVARRTPARFEPDYVSYEETRRRGVGRLGRNLLLRDSLAHRRKL